MNDSVYIQLKHLRDRDFLVQNLCFLQRLITASAPLLDCAISFCAGELQEYYLKHFDEEVGHDDMLAEDLERLGVQDIPPCHTAASIAGSQYYFIQHEHPAMLLGYMLVLESNPMPLSAVEELEKVHGVWLDSLRHHSMHDVEHARQIKEMISLASPELQKRIHRNAELVSFGLAGVAKKLIDKVEVI